MVSGLAFAKNENREMNILHSVTLPGSFFNWYSTGSLRTITKHDKIVLILLKVITVEHYWYKKFYKRPHLSVIMSI